MPVPRRAIVLSDLHLGPGGSLATFRDAVALSGFLRRLASPTEPPTELVLAGDVFDFLQSKDYDGFRADAAPARFVDILTGPSTAPVVEALGELARDRRHEITLLAGNHDPEVLLPEVRRQFEEAIGRVGSVRYADDEPLVARSGDDWPVWGRAIGNDAGTVWVVHGDRWDPANAIDREALLLAVRNGRPVELPPGSHLVYEVLSHLQPMHSWAVELKPELPAVLPLLLYVNPVLTSAYLKKHWGLGGELLGGFVDGALGRGPLFDAVPGGEPLTPSDELPAASVEEGLAVLLAEGLRSETPSDPRLLVGELVHLIDHGPSPETDGTLSAMRGLGRVLLSAWLAGLHVTDRFHALDGPDSTPKRARRWLPKDLVALVAGHTHGPRLQPGQRPAYYNTGTWTPVGSLPRGGVNEVVLALEDGRWGAEAPRTFVRIDCDDGPPSVHLGRCDAEGTPREIPFDAPP